VNPRPLISFHETQLALDDAQLILSRLSLPSYAFVRASQFQELKDGDKAKGDGRGGQNGGPPNKSASQPNYGLLAYALVVLLLGFFCVLGGGDLPLNFHPAAVRASANVTPFGAMSVPA
jgi:hypothetical protein